MSIKAVCFSCGEELTKPGAIMISPPTAGNDVIKYNLCCRCWEQLLSWILVD